MGRRVIKVGTDSTPATELKPKVGISYCSECGAEVHAGFFPCGHMGALLIDDPKNAKTYNPPAGTARIASAEAHHREKQQASHDASKQELQPTVEVTKAPVVKAPVVISDSTGVASDDDIGEAVSYTHGEELYTPQQFFSYRVGPFSATTRIRAGENRIDALRRIRSDLAAFAEEERKTKLTAFLDTVNVLFANMAERKAGR